MPTDSLTEAVAAMETAWRRLREVLDGPDVAAALVERRGSSSNHWRSPIVELRRIPSGQEKKPDEHGAA